MKKFSLLSALATVAVAASVQAVDVELVKNGGFESGLTDWTTTFNVTSGNNYAATLFPRTGSGMAIMPILATLDSALAQDVDPTGATSAVLGFSLNLSALDVSRFVDLGTDKVVVSIGGTEVYSESLNDAFGGGAAGTGWVDHTGIVVPVGLLGSGPISFRFDVDNIPPGGDLGQFFVALVDDVSLVATYPPKFVNDGGMTLVLLGASVLGVTRLRRVVAQA